jgi:Tol biopolymer transport system component
MTLQPPSSTWLKLLCLTLGCGVFGAVPVPTGRAQAPAPPDALIGYTEYRTNLPGGRQVNVMTMRAIVVKADGTGRRVLAEALTQEPNTWTQFAGWSPDGSVAILNRCWESWANARWEEQHKTFRFTKEGWLCDCYLLDLASGQATNATARERVSFYNAGLLFWPGEPTKLGFQAMIGGNIHPFVMDRDGRNKRDLTKGIKGFTYGANPSPDGKRIVYHENYQLYFADADGANTKQVKTGHPFNFVPLWSPDGAWVLFLAGQQGSPNCHPHVVRANGTGLRKLADRGGYLGLVEILDMADFHGGSSDYPVWSADGRSVFYTARCEGTVELFRTTLDGKSEQLTNGPAGSRHYHPQPSPDGSWLAYGSKRAGVRQLYVMRLEDKKEHLITDLKEGRAAMWPYWQPAGKKRGN